MAENTKIEWCTHTFNAWIGCTATSPACDHCYAEKLAKAYGWAEWGVGKPRMRTSPANWAKPLKWNREAVAAGTRPTVFSNSLSDWADPEVPEEWRADLFAKIRQTPQLDWLLLTKRHALALRYLREHAKGITNIRIGMTVENNNWAILRLTRLINIADVLGLPTFVSYEPALGPVNWKRWLDRDYIEGGRIGWLIAGGESGHQARPPHPDWFRAARDACARHGVPFFFKQWGEYHPSRDHDERVTGCTATPTAIRGDGRIEHRPLEAGWLISDPDSGYAGMCRLGKKAAGAMLDGREHREFPT